MSRASIPTPRTSAKEKLLQAALMLIRSQGYSATTVDALCESAGVTKGSFFHHFESKEELGVEAARYWSRMTSDFFKGASYHQHSDPLDRFLAYIDFRREILRGKTPEYSCLVGTMVQEAYDTHPEIRKACQASLFSHAESLEDDINEAIKVYKPSPAVSARSLAIHTQAVIQGAFILAKASGSAALAAESLDHLKNYVRLLFAKKKYPPKRGRSHVD